MTIGSTLERRWRSHVLRGSLEVALAFLNVLGIPTSSDPINVDLSVAILIAYGKSYVHPFGLSSHTLDQNLDRRSCERSSEAPSILDFGTYPEGPGTSLGDS